MEIPFGNPVAPEIALVLSGKQNCEITPIQISGYAEQLAPPSTQNLAQWRWFR